MRSSEARDRGGRPEPTSFVAADGLDPHNVLGWVAGRTRRWAGSLLAHQYDHRREGRHTRALAQPAWVKT